MIHRFTSKGKLYGLACYSLFQALNILGIYTNNKYQIQTLIDMSIFGITRKPFQYEPHFRIKSIFL